MNPAWWLLYSALGCHGSLDGLLEAKAPFLVHGYQSPDGHSWTRTGPAIAGGFSSLGAVVSDDEVLITGLPATPPTWWEERFPSLFVATLVSPDGLSWATRRLSVEAPGTALIDPQLVMGPDGLELWFVQAEGTGDPGQGQRETRLVRTRQLRPHAAEYGKAELWYTGRGLVDVAPVWLNGELRVYATRGHSEIVEIAEVNGQKTERVIVGGVTVPFPLAHAGGVWLWGQAPVDGGMRPVRLNSADGRTWSAPEALVRDPTVTSCASPVVVPWRAAWRLWCVEEPGRR